MNQEQFEAAVLAREPYLWIEEVVSIDDDRIHARKYLDPEMPLFAAHYKGFPLFPGALQCEAAFQASAVLIARTQPAKPNHLPVIARVRNVKFRNLVRPGSTIDVIVERRDVVGKAIQLRGVISVDGVTTTELDFVATEAALPAEQRAAVG